MKLRRGICSLVLAGFLLGVHDGYIALWKGEDPEPVRVFPYSAELLPPEDRAALEKGIPIRSREDLTALLEDFCS